MNPLLHRLSPNVTAKLYSSLCCFSLPASKLAPSWSATWWRPPSCWSTRWSMPSSWPLMWESRETLRTWQTPRGSRSFRYSLSLLYLSRASSIVCLSLPRLSFNVSLSRSLFYIFLLFVYSCLYISLSLSFSSLLVSVCLTLVFYVCLSRFLFLSCLLLPIYMYPSFFLSFVFYCLHMF